MRVARVGFFCAEGEHSIAPAVETVAAGARAEICLSDPT